MDILFGHFVSCGNSSPCSSHLPGLSAHHNRKSTVKKEHMFKKALAMIIFARYSQANSLETPVPLKCNVAETKDNNNVYSSNNTKTSDL